MLAAWVDEELARLDTQSLRRDLHVTDPALMNFASNNYLDLARHPSVVAAANAALQEWGASTSSSRLLSGHTPLHAALEKALAAWLKKEAALVFPSGYMANIGVVGSLAGAQDAIVMDRLCHASLIDAARLSGARLFVYAHGDADDAERVLKRAQSYRRRLLLTESLFSMDGDQAPLKELRVLADQYQALAIVDEAHALGVFGTAGQGLSEGWDVVLGTLSKALGSQGGFAAGSTSVVTYLLNRARPFMFTTGLAPASAGAALGALERIRHTSRAGEALQTRAAGVRGRLRAQGWNLLQSESQILPIHVGTAEDVLTLAKALEHKGFYVPAIRPPTVHAGECRLRLSLTLEHSEDQLNHLVDALGECHE